MPGDWCGAKVIAPCDCLTDGKVARWNEMELLRETEGGDSAPDAARADG